MADIKSVVYHGPEDIRVEQRPMPTCGTGELLVKVDACAVCGSDLKAYRHGNPRLQPPRIMGHEFTGLIETAGPGVTEWSTGDRVVMATSVSCGQCLYCQRGWPNLCNNLAAMGFAYDGGMAEYVTIPALAVERGHVIKVPGDVPAHHAALAEPLSCAVHCCSLCRITAGDVVMVLGAGPMGILNACVARQMGARRVIITDPNEHRRTQAQTFGFDAVLDPTDIDLVAWIRSQTAGHGADAVIVAAPATHPQAQAPLLVRKRGTACWFASLPVGKCDVTVDSRVIHYGEVFIVGSSDSSPADVEQAVTMLADGSVSGDKLVSHELPLDDVHNAFALMESGQALRVVLRP